MPSRDHSKVETLIERLKPDAILTHHAGHRNIDHRRIHQAVVTACRPQPGTSVRQLPFFEVASSTEWQTTPPAPCPSYQMSLWTLQAELEAKIEALNAYSEEGAFLATHSIASGG